MSENILLDAPNLGSLEKEFLLNALDSNYVSTVGPFVPEFEKKFAAYLQATSSVSVQSGTAALHMALYELGIGPGDEVIVPAVTFVATVNPVIYVGATPVFVDIDGDTWNMDPAEVVRAISPKTRAIIPVHLYGNPCNMDAIMDIARDYGLYVIEDATESLGATCRDRMTGTLGDIGCFSFNGNKVITTGGGGMITTHDENRAKHLKFLVNQARDETKGYFHPEVGFNYRMTNLEASLGLAQLERLPEFLQKKHLFRQIYREVFQGSDGLEMQKEQNGCVSSAWFSSVKINAKKFGLTIPEIQERLKQKGVPARRIFRPILDFPPYAVYKHGEYRQTYELYHNGLNLPSSTLNTPEGIRYAATTLLNVLVKR